MYLSICSYNCPLIPRPYVAGFRAHPLYYLNPHRPEANSCALIQEKSKKVMDIWAKGSTFPPPILSRLERILKGDNGTYLLLLYYQYTSLYIAGCHPKLEELEY
jgi:hypothetical protein